ncbi:MAG: CGNR zinc finger domain-containing protein [Janthinobacterium lividum]
MGVVLITPSFGLYHGRMAEQGGAERSSARQMRPSPDAVDLVLSFANTRVDGGGRVEQFADSAGLSRWLVAHGRGEASGGVTSADAAAVREVRDAVVTVLLAHTRAVDPDGPDLQEAERYLRRIAERYPLVVRVDHTGVRLVPAGAGLNGVVGELFAALTGIALSDAWSRIKACRNEPCHFAFFDRSRNTSALYCSAACGTQVAMRTYRRRQREDASSPAESD